MGALLTAALLLAAEAPAPAVVPQDRPKPQATRRATPRRPASQRGDVYYPNCAAARAAGVAPIRRGQPGYRPGLDRDGDGIACEPWRGRR